jgi:hypothetical protein
MPIRRIGELTSRQISGLIEGLPIHVPSDSILGQLNIGLHEERMVDDFRFFTDNNRAASGFEFSTAISQTSRTEEPKVVHRRYGFMLDGKPPEGFHIELDDYSVELNGRLWTIDTSEIVQPKLKFNERFWSKLGKSALKYIHMTPGSDSYFMHLFESARSVLGGHGNAKSGVMTITKSTETMTEADKAGNIVAVAKKYSPIFELSFLEASDDNATNTTEHHLGLAIASGLAITAFVAAFKGSKNQKK